MKFHLAFATCAIASSTAFAQPQPAPRHDDCHNCGVVESVQKVTRTDKARGIAGTPVTPGMAVGGVLGGVLGNQVGHGSGRTAATVVGAAGGAYAGHEIERKGRQYMAYVMHVRMADGSMRTIEQKTAIARGSHVIVDGHTARLDRGAQQRNG